MDWERRSIRVCAAAVVCAVTLRLFGSGTLGPLAAALQPDRWGAFVLYLETGRIVKTLPSPETTAATVPPPVDKPRVPLVLKPEALEAVQIKYSCSYRPDLEALLEQPLDWNLREEAPAVLILHTHTSESYTKQSGDSYSETSDYHTMDEAYNMLRVGDAIEARLEEAGIGVVHDRQFHDYPSYSGSYNHAREGTDALMAQYPSIRLVLDIHRDAMEADGTQLGTQAQVKGQDSAQLMLVVGSDEGGLEHPHWAENLALALKLDAVLEDLYPGVCRPISFRAERYNQDESPGAILVEVGAAGDTLPEALTAADALCDGIIALANGAEINKSN